MITPTRQKQTPIVHFYPLIPKISLVIHCGKHEQKSITVKGNLECTNVGSKFQIGKAEKSNVKTSKISFLILNM